MGRCNKDQSKSNLVYGGDKQREKLVELKAVNVEEPDEVRLAEDFAVSVVEDDEEGLHPH